MVLTPAGLLHDGARSGTQPFSAAPMRDPTSAVPIRRDPAGPRCSPAPAFRGPDREQPAILISMLVAVTGGSGFLGAHVVRRLLARGDRVRVLVRPAGDRRNLAGLPVETVDGLLGEGPLGPGFPGSADLVIHLAAVLPGMSADEPTLFRVNVEGTRAVLEAARRDRVPRFLHVSTIGTCAPAPGGRPATEADRPEVTRLSAYARSKLAAEDLALGFRGLEVVAGLPAAPVGAWDRRPTVTGERVRAVLEGRWPDLLPGPVNHVPARGCAEGLLLVAAHGCPGARYLLGGENLAPEEFVARVAGAGAVPPPGRPLLDRLRRWRSRPLAGLAVDDRRAREELGYRPGDLDEAFREAAAWFRCGTAPPAAPDPGR